MADREEEELQMALRMSLQGSPSPPEAKRSKPRESAVEESPEARGRRMQRELMAAAAEKRIRSAESSFVRPAGPAEAVVGLGAVGSPPTVTMVEAAVPPEKKVEGGGSRGSSLHLGEELSREDADQLFSMIFGDGVSKNILSQWTNQGIRFSSDPETCMGLVQHEGGPCGVLAAIQAFVLKYLLFFPDELGMPLQSLGRRRLFQSSYAAIGNFTSITEDRKSRALVLCMVEILFLCGNKRRAVVATLDVFNDYVEDGSEESQNDEMITKALEGLSIESASDLQKVLRVKIYTSETAAFNRLMTELPLLRSRMGAMLFLISALLSRGLDAIQSDRDDPSLPLVTAPFGHASQEIVNLLLCGQAVPNVFDGRMDLGGGMSLKGIPTSVEVGFLTLLESLNFCKVGQYLKWPKWPIWVVGSESHYTVLFALDTSVQDENELEERESKIRRAFDLQDQSGGGGFISVEGFQQVLRETNINFPPEKIDNLSSSGIVVWSEFWQALLELDKNLGGLKDPSGLMGKKHFDIYHFNGIAKSVPNGSFTVGSESPMQRPRLCKLSVSVPPKWTQEEYLADVVVPTSNSDGSRKDSSIQLNPPPQPPQHAPLVDCIRTRWSRAVCSWVGDIPSIV